MTDGTRAVEETEEQQRTHWLCTHCGQPEHEHPSDKCLYGPTAYEPRLCEGCGRGFLPVQSQRRNWTTTHYHWQCHPERKLKPQAAS